MSGANQLQLGDDIERTARLRKTDSFVIPFRLREADGSDRLNIPGADIYWEIQDTRTREPVLSSNSPYVSIINRNPSEGEFEIKLEPEATAELRASRYREVLELDDIEGNREVWVGANTFLLMGSRDNMRINPNVLRFDEVQIERTARFRQTDSFAIPFKLREAGGDTLNISGATITWEMQESVAGDTVASLSDSDIEVINRDSPEGEFEIRLNPEATEDVDPGAYREVLEIIDREDNEKTWVGDNTIEILRD